MSDEEAKAMARQQVKLAREGLQGTPPATDRAWLQAEIAGLKAANATLSEALRVAREEAERLRVEVAEERTWRLAWRDAHRRIMKKRDQYRNEASDARARLATARLAFLSIRRCTSRADSGGCETCQDEADLAIVALDATAPVPTRAAGVPASFGPVDVEVCECREGWCAIKGTALCRQKRPTPPAAEAPPEGGK